jgi:predicted unusual protein kinase regulating ubiquinone biosynthesis (AarF/ABC1/UbiB family)
MDFVSEYNNQCLFIDIYKELPYVRIPTLYKELCNSEQLVMTKLTGISINDLTEEEKIQTTIWLSKLTLHSLMKYGYAHSDLHAGNMLFNRDHIGIIDFGFILKLNEEEKENFYHLLKEFAFDNLEKAAYHTIQMTAPIETCRQLSVDAIKDISKFIIHVYKNATIFHKFFSVYDILQINKKLRIYDLEISSTFYKLVVSLNSIEAVLENLSSSTIDLFIGAISDIEEY